MIDFSLEWCTYRTFHDTGFFYLGKGKTVNVLNGTYTGSGVRYKLALTTDQFSASTWSTKILATYSTEDAAYDAEALLVPHELLASPWCLNMTSGGNKGKYKTHGTLLKKYNTAKKAKTRQIAKDRAKVKKQIADDKIKSLKQQLKEKK